MKKIFMISDANVKYKFFTTNNIIILTIVFTIFTRCFHLTFQSLWFDELYGINIAGPANSVGSILSDIKTDFHPPLYYLLLHGIFQLFPYNDFVARLSSAIIGMFSVFLMYLFGKNLKNKNSGILMALLTSFFYFHIRHSQEVRMYIWMFALALVTSVIFLKLISKPGIYYNILYVVFTTLMLYTHYYGFFVVFAQFVCLVHLIIKKQNLNIRPRNFILIYICVFITYFPWIPHLFDTGQRHHFMSTPDLWYFFPYLYDYTGKEPLTAIFVLFGLGLFIKLFVNRKKSFKEKISSENLLVLYSLISLYVIPYIISFFKPIVNIQSTVIALPFLLAAVVIGLEQLNSKQISIMFGIIILSNFINIIFINRYYTKNEKENFKQISYAINSSVSNSVSPIAVTQFADFYKYYFRQMNSRFRLYNPYEIQPEVLLNSTKTFFVINAPFTIENSRNLEPLDKLGFQIVYPRLMDIQNKRISIHQNWVYYIERNFNIDTIFIDGSNKREVAFRYKRKSTLQNRTIK